MEGGGALGWKCKGRRRGVPDVEFYVADQVDEIEPFPSAEKDGDESSEQRQRDPQ